MTDSTPPDPNFFFPVHELEHSVLKLALYDPSLHSQAFFDGLVDHPECFTYLPRLPFPSVASVDVWFEEKNRKDKARVLFAMIDKTRSNQVAGVVGLLNTVPENLSTELGIIMVLPAFQRTHVTRTALGLLLRYCFDELRLRRVQWRTDPENIASIRACERVGFQREGIRRWERVAPPGVPGHAPRKGDPMPNCTGWHSLTLAICWDDWEERVSEHVATMLGDSEKR